MSQRVRKRIEQGFGWVKTIGGLRQWPLMGLAAVRGWVAWNFAAYNLIRTVVPAISVSDLRKGVPAIRKRSEKTGTHLKVTNDKRELSLVTLEAVSRQPVRQKYSPGPYVAHGRRIGLHLGLITNQSTKIKRDLLAWRNIGSTCWPTLLCRQYGT